MIGGDVASVQKAVLNLVIVFKILLFTFLLLSLMHKLASRSKYSSNFDSFHVSGE